jgi:hypothetical protein
MVARLAPSLSRAVSDPRGPPCEGCVASNVVGLAPERDDLTRPGLGAVVAGRGLHRLSASAPSPGAPPVCPLGTPSFGSFTFSHD